MKYGLKVQFSLMFEKVLSTFVQVFVVTLLGMNNLGADAQKAAGLAAIAAGASAALAALPVIPDGLPWATDLFWRIVRTFVVSFGTLFFAANSDGTFNMSVSGAQAAAYAGAIAVLVFLKGWIAKRTGAQNSAAVLPSSVDPASFALAS
jgi:hypothetical protein